MLLGKPLTLGATQAALVILMMSVLSVNGLSFLLAQKVPGGRGPGWLLSRVA